MMYPSGIGTPSQIFKVLVPVFESLCLTLCFAVWPNAIVGISDRTRKNLATEYFMSRLLDGKFRKWWHYRATSPPAPQANSAALHAKQQDAIYYFLLE